MQTFLSRSRNPAAGLMAHHTLPADGHEEQVKQVIEASEAAASARNERSRQRPASQYLGKYGNTEDGGTQPEFTTAEVTGV